MRNASRESGKSWYEHQFLVDPHTADGLNAAYKMKIDGVKTICLETALPAKFGKTIVEAVGFEPRFLTDMKAYRKSRKGRGYAGKCSIS